MESNDDPPNSESVPGSEPRHESEINPDDKLMIDYDAILVRVQIVIPSTKQSCL